MSEPFPQLLHQAASFLLSAMVAEQPDIEVQSVLIGVTGRYPNGEPIREAIITRPAGQPIKYDLSVMLAIKQLLSILQKQQLLMLEDYAQRIERSAIEQNNALASIAIEIEAAQAELLRWQNLANEDRNEQEASPTHQEDQIQERAEVIYRALDDGPHYLQPDEEAPQDQQS